MDKLWQWIPLFTTGFLISRIFARTGLAERLLNYLLKRSGGRFPLLLLAIVGAATFLSFFIPNMLTVLTLLAVIEKLRNKLEEISIKGANRLITPLGLALIYGANIGGMGSMVGSPANALMLFWLSYLKVPGREHIDFLSWLMWGVPLAVIFALLAWGLLVLFLVPRHLYHLRISLDEPQITKMQNHSKWGGRIAFLSAFFWINISLLLSLFPKWLLFWNALAVSFGVLFVLYVFFWKLGEGKEKKRPLLKWEDCYQGLPWRGVFIALSAGLLGTLFIWMKIPQWLAMHLQDILPEQMPIFIFYLIFSIITIFATELISNTAVSVALFPIAFELANKLHYHPLPVMMLVALASTCAFMSPLATPATGLAFGGMKGLSLKRMLSLGIIVNLIGGLWITWFLTNILPRFYHISLLTQ